MRYSLDESKCRNLEVSARREWLLTNGIGGYAMGTASGINTRRYHGHLIAALEPPAKRTMLLASIEAAVQTDGNPIGLSTNQYPGAIHPEGFHYLTQFEVGHAAVWRFEVDKKVSISKTLIVHTGENACTIRYRNDGKAPVLLILNPLVTHRDHHANSFEHSDYPRSLKFPKGQTVVEHNDIVLIIRHPDAQRSPVQGWYYRFEHARESERGLNPRDDLFCPCELRYELRPGEEAVLTASVGTECAEVPAPPEGKRRSSLETALKEAAAKYVVEGESRASIIAGYPWFTDWGRDTMIALPGICLQTGNVTTARRILLDYAAACVDGLIPNRFTESAGTDYNTVDATLWFVNAAYKTLEAEWDEPFAKRLWPTLKSVFDFHVKGTKFGIRVDPFDGLLTQGEPGVQLTWMDAKIGDWVVTPRHGKPVEINGLWINACRVLEWLADKLGEPALQYSEAGEKAELNFQLKFWHEVRGHYLDTVDPADASLRPNQLIAMALPFGPATGDRAKRALEVVKRELLTPVGLRTLGPHEQAYRGRFQGPISDLDAAYHQGTVWPWLLGAYASAVVRIDGDRKEARRALRQVAQMLEEYGVGGIAECYDGDAPHQPGGCPFQAWSVGEILRAWIEDAGGAG